MRKARCQHTEYRSNPPKHKVDSLLDLICAVSEIRDGFTYDFNGNAR